MTDQDDDFFAGKRPWSKIKDKVLGSYMKPYIAKAVKRGKPLLLIDGYAGPGVFGDGTAGSPMLMCQAAEQNAKGKYLALFINKEPKSPSECFQGVRKSTQGYPTLSSQSTAFRASRCPRRRSRQTFPHASGQNMLRT